AMPTEPPTGARRASPGPGRRAHAKGVILGCGAPGTAPLSVPARVLPRGVRGRTRRGAAVRVRGAPDARRAVALRVPPARADVRRRAGADAAAASRHPERHRRPAPRTGRGDLRARALGPERERRRRALPDDPPA